MIYMWCNISEKEQHFRWLRETMKWEQRGKFFEIARAFLRNTTCKITCKSCLGLKRNCSFFFLFYGSLLFVNECFRATEQLPGTRGRTIRNSMVFLRAIRVINDGTWRWWAVFDEINSTLVSGIEQLVRIYRNDWTIESKEKKKRKKTKGTFLQTIDSVAIQRRFWRARDFVIFWSRETRADSYAGRSSWKPNTERLFRVSFVLDGKFCFAVVSASKQNFARWEERNSTAVARKPRENA